MQKGLTAGSRHNHSHFSGFAPKSLKDGILARDEQPVRGECNPRLALPALKLLRQRFRGKNGTTIARPRETL